MSDLQNPVLHNQETQSQENESILALRAAREMMADTLAASEIKSAFSTEQTERFTTNLTAVEYDGLTMYDGQPSTRTLLALDAVGVQSADVFSALATSRESDGKSSIANVELDDSVLAVAAQKGELLYNLSSIDDVDESRKRTKSELIQQKIQERLLSSPAYKAARDAGAELEGLTDVPDRVSTEPFDYKSDPIGTLTFLAGKGMFYEQSSLFRKLAEGVSPEDVLQFQLENLPKYAATTTSTQEFTSYKWMSHHRAAQQELRVDHATGLATFSAEKRTTLPYLEKANQAEARSLPFIETECARNMSDFLESAGLMFHPKLQAEMISMGESDRYGSVYTQLTREIAKWVDDPKRFQLRELFVLDDQNFSAASMMDGSLGAGIRAISKYEDYLAQQDPNIVEQQIRSAYSSAQHTVDGESAGVLFGMIDGVMARADHPDDEWPTDLPVTSENIQIKDGACFDVVAYYMGAASDRSGLTTEEQEGVSLLHKTHGVDTYLTQEPITFNGVPLPKGSLFSKDKSGSWAFLRLTPFAFDEPQDQLAFGSEMSKMFINEEQAVRRIGDTTLSSLVERVS